MDVESDPSTTSAVSEVPAERVPLRTLLAYGPPLFGLTSLLFFVQLFFLEYATDVLLLAPATIGIVFALGRAWDPIVGSPTLQSSRCGSSSRACR